MEVEGEWHFSFNRYQYEVRVMICSGFLKVFIAFRLRKASNWGLGCGLEGDFALKRGVGDVFLVGN